MPGVPDAVDDGGGDEDVGVGSETDEISDIETSTVDPVGAESALLQSSAAGRCLCTPQRRERR